MHGALELNGRGKDPQGTQHARAVFEFWGGTFHGWGGTIELTGASRDRRRRVTEWQPGGGGLAALPSLLEQGGAGSGRMEGKKGRLGGVRRWTGSQGVTSGHQCVCLIGWMDGWMDGMQGRVALCSQRGPDNAGDGGSRITSATAGKSMDGKLLHDMPNRLFETRSIDIPLGSVALPTIIARIQGLAYNY